LVTDHKGREVARVDIGKQSSAEPEGGEPK